MADEIEVTLRLALNETATDASLKSLDEIKRTELKVTQTSKLLAANVQTIGFAAHEALAMGDVAAAGYAFFRNLDATNFVLIGTDAAGTFHPFAKLKKGEAGVIRLGTNAPYAKADTGAVNLYCKILSD